MPLLNVGSIQSSVGEQLAADRAIVASLIGGDAAAAAHFVREFQFLVMRELRRFSTLSGADREDLFQGVFLKLFENKCRALRGWGQQSSFEGYLRSLVRNFVIDELRSTGRLPTSQSIDETDECYLVSDTEDPEALVRLNELRRLMLLAIQQLAPPDREIIQMVDLEGLSYREAASRAGITPNAAGVRLLSARRRLAKIIESQFPALKGAWNLH